MRDFGRPVPRVFSRCLREHEDGHRQRRRHYGDMPLNVATITTTGYLCPYNHEDMTIYRRRKDGDMRIGRRGAGRSDDPLAMPSNQRSFRLSPPSRERRGYNIWRSACGMQIADRG